MQTNLYTNYDKNEDHFCVEKEKVLNFLGVLLLSGYYPLLGEQHYWSNQLDMGVSIVSKALSRKDFLFLPIKSKIRFLENSTLDGSNKMVKIDPFYSTLNASFIKYGIFHDRLSIGKSMVPYYGRHRCKMFVRGKPIRFGYKLWGVCGPDKYPYKLNI